MSDRQPAEDSTASAPPRRERLAIVARSVLPPVCTVLLFVALVFLVFIPALEENFLARKRELTRRLVEAAWSSLASRQAEVEEGRISLEEAKERAVMRLRDFRYGPEGKDYYWIIDTEPRVVMHPYRTDLEGENVGDYADSAGTYLFRDMLDVVRRRDAGFVSYRWQWKDDPRRMGEKISYVKEFEPWGWIIGTGVYTGEIEERLAIIRREFLGVSLAVLALVAVVGGWMGLQSVRAETRRRRAEAALADSERKYRELVEEAGSLILRLDADGTIRFANEYAGVFFDRDPEDLSGEALTAVVPDAWGGSSGQHAALDRLLSATEPGVSEATTVIPGPEDDPVWISWSRRRADGGGKESVLLVGNDITETKRLQQSLAESLAARERLGNIVDRSPVVAFTWRNEEGWPVEFVSDSIRQFGWTPDDLTSGRVAYIELVHPDDRERVVAEVRARADDPAQTTFRQEYRIRDADGTDHWLDDRTWIVRDTSGVVTHFQGVVLDVTERVRAEAEIAKRNDELQAHREELLVTNEELRDTNERLIAAGEELSESEARSRRYLDIARVVILGLDGEGRVDLVNQEGLRILDAKDESEVLGKNWFEAFLPDDFLPHEPDIMEWYDGLLHGKVDLGPVHENPVVSLSGARRLMQWRSVVLRDADGAPAGVLSSGLDVTEERRLSEQIEEQARFLQILLDTTQVPLFYKDADLRYIGCNEAMAEFFGIARGEIEGLTASDLMAADFAETCDRQARVLLTSPGVHRSSGTLRRADGKEREVLFTRATFLDASGDPAGVVGAFVDVTDMREAERTLREKDRRHQALFAAGRTMQFVLAPDRAILEMDELAERITGYEAPEVTGRGFGDVFIDDDPARRALFDECCVVFDETGECHNREIEISIKGGAFRRTVVLNAIRDDPAAGKASNILVSAQDVTEIRLARERQRILEQRLADILRHAPVVLQTVDRGGRFLYTSENVETIFGIPPDALFAEGKTWRDFVHPDDVVEIEKAFASVAEHPLVSVEYRVRPLTGEDGHRWARGHFSPAFDRAGGRDVYSAVLMEITEERTARDRADMLQEQLFQSEKMRAVGELAGGIAHDFNNLLAGIMGSAELLSIRGGLRDRDRKYVDSIIDTANQAASLVQQINAFARKGAYQSVPVDVHDVVDRVVHILRHTIDRRIEIRTELHACPSRVVGDPTHLQNAVLNLAVNARDAMPDGGVVTFATDRVVMDGASWLARGAEMDPGTYLRIEVRDTGTGIPKDILDKVFEPFFTTKAEGKGTGLGLASVYGCIQSHDGHVAVRSAKGEGTTFAIYLPQPEEIAPAPVEEAVAVSEPSRASGVVLIVDDEALVRKNAALVLRNNGYEVLDAAEGDAALALFRERREEIDLVVLDMIMPGMSGEEVFRRMREIDPTTRVVVATGYAGDHVLDRLAADGVVGIVQKPFRLREFADAVARAIEGEPL